METTNKKSIYRWMRVLHRDIGFFVIGLTIIYCISGIMLTYRDTGFLKSEMEIEKSLSPGLSSEQLLKKLGEKKLKVTGQNETEIYFTNGIYSIETGAASYVKNEIPTVLKALNMLHIAPSQNPKHLFTIVYAAALLFLAVSSFWMYRPGSRFFKRGIITSIFGAAAAFMLVAF